MEYSVICTDVLIIGGGGAGLRAAISSAQEGVKTIIISKGKVNRSGATLLAGANISADIGCDGGNLARLGIDNSNANDTPSKWFDDILNEGFYLNEQNLLEKYVNLAPICLEELVNWGMPIFGMEGDRGVSVSAVGILNALYTQIKNLGIYELSDTIALEIIIKNERIDGIIAWDIINGKLLYIKSKSVVLATGGAHNLFSLNSGSADLNGDGQALALRAGVELIDMEMISFCPTTILYPRMYRGNILPYILLTLGYGEIVNNCKDAFLQKFYTGQILESAINSEWNKLLLSRAINQEIINNPTLNGGVYFRMKPEEYKLINELKKNYPGLMKHPYKEIMDILHNNQLIEVAPACHYFEGGIKINDRCETNLKGLYGAGECTGGVFGSNRVAAATTEMLILGLIAGKEAAKYSKNLVNSDNDKNNIPRYFQELNNEIITQKKFSEIMYLKNQLKSLMQDNLGVIRNAEGINKVIKFIEKSSLEISNFSFIPGDESYNMYQNEIIELRNMLDCAQIIAISSITREESRGVFYRSDYPSTDNDSWLKHVVVIRKENEIQTNIINISDSTRKLPRGKYEYEEYLNRVICGIDI